MWSPIAQMLIFRQRNPTQVFKGWFILIFPWNQSRTHHSYKVLCEDDPGTSWQTTCEQHSTALLMMNVQPPGTQSWTEQLRTEREAQSWPVPVPDPDKAFSAMLSTIRLWNSTVFNTNLCSCQAAQDEHSDASSSSFPCSCLQTLFFSMFFGRRFSLGDPQLEFWIGAF